MKLTKKVKVSDPWMWYDQEEITVEMWHDSFFEDDTVRIMFDSIDDFQVYRDFNEWDLEANWRWCEKWLWDKIPEVVGTDWMYEHGYAPF